LKIKKIKKKEKEKKGLIYVDQKDENELTFFRILFTHNASTGSYPTSDFTRAFSSVVARRGIA
jgi:hypothetical protein